MEVNMLNCKLKTSITTLWPRPKSKKNHQKEENESNCTSHHRIHIFLNYLHPLSYVDASLKP